MLVINGMEIDPIAAGMIGSLIVFVIQIVFCHKVKNRTVKRVPMFTLLCGVVFSMIMYCGLLGDGAVELGNQMLGFSMLIMFAIMYVGDLLGWVIYGFYRRMQEHRDNMQL